MPSSASVTGDEMTYPPLAHFPRSMVRQRSLQKGKSGFFPATAFLQTGHRSFGARLRTITKLYAGLHADETLVQSPSYGTIFATRS